MEKDKKGPSTNKPKIRTQVNATKTTKEKKPRTAVGARKRRQVSVTIPSAAYSRRGSTKSRGSSRYDASQEDSDNDSDTNKTGRPRTSGVRTSKTDTKPVKKDGPSNQSPDEKKETDTTRKPDQETIEKEREMKSKSETEVESSTKQQEKDHKSSTDGDKNDAQPEEAMDRDATRSDSAMEKTPVNDGETGVTETDSRKTSRCVSPEEKANNQEPKVVKDKEGHGSKSPCNNGDTSLQRGDKKDSSDEEETETDQSDDESADEVTEPPDTCTIPEQEEKRKVTSQHSKHTSKDKEKTAQRQSDKVRGKGSSNKGILSKTNGTVNKTKDQSKGQTSQRPRKGNNGATKAAEGKNRKQEMKTKREESETKKDDLNEDPVSEQKNDSSALEMRPIASRESVQSTYKDEATQSNFAELSMNSKSEADCIVLRQALFGKKVDKLTITHVLSNRSRQQRLQIKAAYRSRYDQEIVDDFRSLLRGDYQDLTVALMQDQDTQDAALINFALKGIGTNETALIHILASRSSKDLVRIKQKYLELYDHDVDEDIKGDTNGSFQILCLVQLNKGEEEELVPSELLAEQDARRMWKPGKRQSPEYDDVTIELLTSVNAEQLAFVSNTYQEITGITFKEAVRKSSKGDFQDALLALAECLEDSAGYHADTLNKAMKGFRRNDRIIINVIVSRMEIDLCHIRERFNVKYRRTLEQAIRSNCGGGDYGKLLLALVAKAN